MNKVYVIKMNLEEYTILYDEINEKNIFLVDKFKKSENHKLGVVTFTHNDTDTIDEYLVVKYCKKRNLCRLYDPSYSKFDLEETVTTTVKVLETFLPADCVIWYCSDKIEWLLEIGFKNPYFCSYDPFLESVGDKIAVNKINDPLFKTNIRRRHDGYDNNPDAFQNPRLSPTREHKNSMFDFSREYLNYESEIELKIHFDFDDLQYLKKLVYGGRTLNDDGTMTQKEVSGVLCLERSGKDFELKIDKTKNFNAHDEEKVRFVNGLINFHTHPLDVYNNYEIDMMYPSPSDYNSILTFLMQKYCFENNCYTLSPLLFSCVITVEGVYIISLNKNYCSKLKREELRKTICYNNKTHYEVKNGVSDSINSKSGGISGYYYGKDRCSKNYYQTHCKYIGDPKDHPLGCTQVGGYDYDTLKHNRTQEHLSHFPEELKKNGYIYDRISQAGKDYCLKMNRRELVTGSKFTNGPVLYTQFYTYEELENESFSIYTCNISTNYLPLQTILNEETIEDIKLFNQR